MQCNLERREIRGEPLRFLPVQCVAGVRVDQQARAGDARKQRLLLVTVGCGLMAIAIAVAWILVSMPR